MLKELWEKRQALIAAPRAIQDKATSEGRSALSEEEQRNWDKAWEDIAAIDKEIERDEQLRKAEKHELEGGTDPQIPAADPSGGGTKTRKTVSIAEYRDARDRFMVGETLTEVEVRAFEMGSSVEETPYASEAYQQEFRNYLTGRPVPPEIRALQVDSDELGGYLQASEQFVARLIKAVDDQVFMRQWATKEMVTTAASLGAPSLDADPADSDWTAEIATGSEDSTMDFGKRALTPHPLAKLLKVSKKLLRATTMGVERIVRDRLAYKFAVTGEKAYLTGSGANQPLGVFTASSQGVSTGRDVSTDNTTTEIRFDGLVNAKYTLKGNYWPRARWMFHRDALKQISKLKDGDGQYIWRESVRVGEPDRVLGFPSFMSEYAPNTFTTGLYVGILGDFSNYWIADALNMQIQRLVELYAATNQDGFIGRLESDGMPVLEEAFVRVKLA